MKKQSSDLAAISIFFAVMLVIHVISQILFRILPLPITPTLNHIPVIVASIIYGPRVGAILGGLMGMVSLVTASILIGPSSFLFSPFAPGGNLNSVIIALVPRILIGIVPYFVYKVIHNKIGLSLAGGLGSMTNTIFVLSGILFLFPDFFADKGGAQAVLTLIVSTNSLTEMVLSIVLSLAIVPVLEKIKQ